MIGMTLGTKSDNESTESGKKDVGIIVLVRRDLGRTVMSTWWQKGCWNYRTSEKGFGKDRDEHLVAKRMLEK